MEGWRSDRQTTRGLEVRRGLRGGLAEKRRRITTRGGVNKKKKRVPGDRRWCRGGRWIPSMQAAWNGWGSSGLSARCPRARGIERETARETGIGSAATPPPRPTGRREPVAYPPRSPTVPARRSRPSTMTLPECCSEAESRRWSTRRAQSTAGQVREPFTGVVLLSGSSAFGRRMCGILRARCRGKDVKYPADLRNILHEYTAWTFVFSKSENVANKS